MERIVSEKARNGFFLQYRIAVRFVHPPRRDRAFRENTGHEFAGGFWSGTVCRVSERLHLEGITSGVSGDTGI